MVIEKIEKSAQSEEKACRCCHTGDHWRDPWHDPDRLTQKHNDKLQQSWVPSRKLSDQLSQTNSKRQRGQLTGCRNSLDTRRRGDDATRQGTTLTFSRQISLTVLQSWMRVESIFSYMCYTATERFTSCMVNVRKAFCVWQIITSWDVDLVQFDWEWEDTFLEKNYIPLWSCWSVHFRFQKEYIVRPVHAPPLMRAVPL